jgi:hypothetical protein
VRLDGVLGEHPARLGTQGVDDEPNGGALRPVRTQERGDLADGPHAGERPRHEPVLLGARGEPRQDRDPVPGGDESLDDAVVQESLADPGRDTRDGYRRVSTQR